jgi:hypothetical protein
MPDIVVKEKKMLEILFKAIEWIIVLVVLLAFVIGAWRHTVEQTLGDPLLVDSSHKAKATRYATLFGKVLWNIAVPVVMVGGILLKFICMMAEDKDDKELTVNNGSIWERDVTGVWYSYGAEEDSIRPPQF